MDEQDRDQRRGEHGASAVEYGLLVTAIATLIVVLVAVLGQLTRGQFSTTCDALSGQGVAGVTASCS